MRVFIPLIVAIGLGALIYLSMQWLNGTGPIRRKQAQRKQKRDVKNYIKRNTDHTGKEPAFWLCGCGHHDFVHEYSGGCRECKCVLDPQDVRDRY